MAQTNALFISEYYIKNNSEIDDNVDVKLLLPTVVYCQRQYIKNTIGSPLYDAIEAEISATPQGTIATAAYLTLVDTYIAPALLAWVMKEAQVPLTYKFRNKSVGKNNSEFSQNIDYTEHKYVKDYYEPRAILYTKDNENFLCANLTTYPLYSQYTTSDEVRARPTTGKTAVWLGAGRYKHSGGRDNY